MIINEEKQKEFEKAAKPLIRFLQKNYYPPVTAYVDSCSAEILEGVCIVKDKSQEDVCSNMCTYDCAKCGKDFQDELYPEGPQNLSDNYDFLCPECKKTIPLKAATSDFCSAEMTITFFVALAKRKEEVVVICAGNNKSLVKIQIESFMRREDFAEWQSQIQTRELEINWEEEK